MIFHRFCSSVDLSLPLCFNSFEMSNRPVSPDMEDVNNLEPVFDEDDLHIQAAWHFQVSVLGKSIQCC